MKTMAMFLCAVALAFAAGCGASKDDGSVASSDDALKGHASCQDKLKKAAIARADQVLNPNFPLTYVDTVNFGGGVYRVTLSDFDQEVRVDVTVDSACNILDISVDEEQGGG